MQQQIQRPQLLAQIRLALFESPAVALLGARQVGKTTLARQIVQALGQAQVYDLERAADRATLQAAPELALRNAKGLVVIDEIQRLPALFATLRPLTDAPDRQVSYLLLGSASPELVRGVSESLAGRVQFIQVPGFSLGEVGVDQQERLWLRGGFPRAFLAASDGAAMRWLEGFRRTFLDRDLPGLGLRVLPLAIERFWTLLAHYHGQVWNAAELARAMSVSALTVNHYRDLLAQTFMLRILPPWFENLGKRQLKSPKVYIRDSGLLHHFQGLASMRELWANPRYGASWEGYALEQVLMRFGERDAYFWRTHRGAELDLLLLRHGQRWGFEFKCSDAPTSTKAMHVALADLQLAHLWVVYPGQDRYPLGERITALPMRELPNLELSGPPAT